MANQTLMSPSEQESMQVAEASREASWTHPSFMRELFLGNFRLDLIHPFPLEAPPRQDFTVFYAALEALLRDHVDSVEIDETGEYPPQVLDRLRAMGAFGMKIPREYGGLGFTNAEYQKVMRLLGAKDGNLVALLSAHQSIGVPQPLKLFGTEAQKRKYLPRCAAGEISAFALTEPDVGSDPARMGTIAERTPEGDAYILRGEKLWCTNGTLAKLLVVMARDAESGKISAFVVETAYPGVEITHRCRFMGLRAIGNAVIRLNDVRVPAENLIGEPGRGLKIALTTLNDGRLSIPNGAVGTAKTCLAICRRWAAERVQWGQPIGRHEAIAHKLNDMAAYTFAMESIASLVTQMADRERFDIRLEAAAAKEWNSARGWEIVDETMQVRGGRGYETERSLAARGEPSIGVERMMRDFRINKIFEGSSEIMHLFMAREAVDKHLEVAGALIDPKVPFRAKLAALPKIIFFYVWWYPSRWLGFSYWPRYAELGRLAPHLRYVDRQCRRLARQIFHGMLVYRAKLQRKQAFLFRIVDIANELFAMAASISRAIAMEASQPPHGAGWEPTAMADMSCRVARRRIERLARDLWRNDDDRKDAAARALLRGELTWLEEDVLPGARHDALSGGAPPPPSSEGSEGAGQPPRERLKPVGAGVGN